jgi:hypothetical protein
MFRLFIAFVTIIFFEIVGILFLRAAAKPLPKLPDRHMSLIVPPSSPEDGRGGGRAPLCTGVILGGNSRTG